jgi:protein-disulfide isomerase
MKTNYVVILLLSATIGVQGFILYRDYSRPSVRSRQQRVIAAPKGSVVDVIGTPTLGSESAKVFLIEFADFECPFCQRHALGVGRQLDREYIATGKIRRVFLNNPLPSHANATMLAVASLCARPSAFWQMHEAIFREMPKTEDDVIKLSLAVPELDPRQFRRCFSERKEAASRVESDRQIAVKLGLSATPSFALGRLAGNGVVIEQIITGAQPFSVFQSSLDELLAK